jgi:hypothetical protein
MSILTPVSPSDHHRSDHPQPPKRYASPPSTAAHRHRRRRHHRPVLISHFSTSDPRSIPIPSKIKRRRSFRFSFCAVSIGKWPMIEAPESGRIKRMIHQIDC